MANKHATTLYTGVTNNIVQRVYQHKNKLIASFTSRYNLTKLVYFETFDHISEAIKREKQIKGGSRAHKVSLIKSINPDFKDLYEELL